MGSALFFAMYQGYGNILYIHCICMFYLNEQTICPILTGKHIKCTLKMHINILCKICFSIFDGLCFI